MSPFGPLLAAVVMSSAVATHYPTSSALAKYTLHSGVDITLANDTAFGGLCADNTLGSVPTVWKVPSAMCDLVRCPRFGLRAGAQSTAGPYCVKGWATSDNRTVDSYLSSTTCGYGAAATTVRGSCNDPEASYTRCPNGGGDTMILESFASGGPAELAETCDADVRCCGFLARRDGTGGSTLQYGYAGNRFIGFDSFTRIPTAPVETHQQHQQPTQRDDHHHDHQAQHDLCRVRTDDVPCLQVPRCPAMASYGAFKLTTSPGDEDATQRTTGQVCWDDVGMHVHETAVSSTPVFTPWAHCDDPVFSRSHVLEIFMAPVLRVTDNPRYYFEMDTAPSGAVWVGLSNNSKGNASTFVANPSTKTGQLPCSGLGSFPTGPTSSAWNASDGSSSSQASSSLEWGVKTTVPWTMWAEKFRPGGSGPWPTWRANFYRYGWPEAPNAGFSNFELSGWSSTHDPSFHIPARFGVLVLS